LTSDSFEGNYFNNKTDGLGTLYEVVTQHDDNSDNWQFDAETGEEKWTSHLYGMGKKVASDLSNVLNPSW
jgi:hypothetical protein